MNYERRFEINDTKVLVVGGAGFVGSNLVKRLLNENARRIVIIDNLMSAQAENIPKDDRVTFIQSSITDDEVLNCLEDDIDYAFQLATYHGNQSSIFDPIADHDNNTLTSLKCFNKLSSFKNIKKVVYSSAGCTVAEKTFGEAKATDEDAPVSLYLDSPYQMSKIFGEFYANYFFKHDGLPIVKARFQNVYGPGEILGAGQWRGTSATVWRNVTPTFIYQALNKMSLTVENEGVATRDFIYVNDIVDGLIRCAVLAEPGAVYNLASGVETSIKELASIINKISENPNPIKFMPKRDWDHSGKRYGSGEKAKAEIGFEAKVCLEDGLIETIAWTKENIDFINNCIQKHNSYINRG